MSLEGLKKLEVVELDNCSITHLNPTLFKGIKVRGVGYWFRYMWGGGYWYRYRYENDIDTFSVI